MQMIAVTDCRIPPSVSEGLKSRGFSILWLPPHPSLPTPVASHPDMLIFFTDHTIITTPQYAEVAKAELAVLTAATGRTLCLAAESVGSVYPRDILFNAAPVGKTLFCLSDYLSKSILADPSYRVVSVRQGYAKCSVIPVSDRALITADSSIANAAEKVGLQVLRIAPGFVRLPGYQTGLIGGATSFTPDTAVREIFFCGSLDDHPQAEDIRQFCRQYGRVAVSLCQAPLSDLGTVFLTERKY